MEDGRIAPSVERETIRGRDCIIPSLKPQAFLRQVVRALLPLGEGIVLDPFAGAGSTLAAAEAIGYASIGIEKDARYFEMACKAIPKLSRFHANGGSQTR
jgi:DNA modification methylase